MYTSEWYLSMKDNVYSTMNRIHDSFNKGFKDLKGMQSELDKFGGKTKMLNTNVDQLNTRLDELTKKRNLSIDSSELNRLNKEIQSTHNQISKLTGNGIGPGTSSRLREGLSMMPGGYLLGMATNPYVLGGAAVAGMGAFAYQSGRTRMGFDRDFAKINATAQLDPQRLGGLRTEIMAMAREAKGADIREIPAAYEKILSATNDPVLSKRILEMSLKGAQAGFTDINTVSNALVGFKSIVGNVSEGDIMDVLFGAKRVGKGELGDFAQYLPRAMSMAPKGTNYKDVAGMYSYLTTKGFDAQTSGMLLENVFNQLGRNDVSKAFKGFGIDLFRGGKMRDMLSIFSELEGKMKGLNQEQQTMMMEGLGFRDMQAKMGIRALIEDMDKLRTIMGEVRSGKKELDAALSFTNNAEQSVQELTNKWIYFKDQFGKLSAPGLIRIVDELNKSLDKVQILSMTPGEKVNFFRDQLAYEYRTKGSKSDYQVEMNGTSSKLADAILANGGSYDDYYSMVGRIRAYSKITQEQIKGNPALYGLKYSFDAGMPTTGDAAFTKPTEPAGNTSTTAAMLDNITGGGGVKNFTINIDHPFANPTIHSATAGEGIEEITNSMRDELARLAQGLETAMGGQ